MGGSVSCAVTIMQMEMIRIAFRKKTKPVWISEPRERKFLLYLGLEEELPLHRRLRSSVVMEV
ncbi:hypothetical protein A6D6_03780 [Alcanivorax xiamenensis]|uniref:Uncharacterized protein n=1 Tax=Alcanivorax xiamenensis TaxID=1177156 RepID=A0ABQ6Y3C7_9GAMM|nr:hypothetical protein A6D6_03780 [Alcanivorax xiamenensis]